MTSTLRRGEAQTLIPADALLDALHESVYGTVTIDCPSGNHSHEVDINGTVDLDWLHETIYQLIEEANSGN